MRRPLPPELKRDFVIFWSWELYNRPRVAMSSNLPQELLDMVEYEPENDLRSWKFDFWMCLLYFVVIYKLGAAGRSCRRRFFFGDKSPRIWGTCPFRSLSAFLDVGGPRGSHIMICDSIFLL